MESLNIINLIEKKSITRLSKDYENRLLVKIKENFNEEQQQLFVTSFYCYLNYDSKNDFVVDFDYVWKWLGFSRKNDGKKVINKNFIIDSDYKVEKTATETCVAVFEDDNKDKIKNGGQNKETIMLTVNAFKKFCLKAGTKKADEVHDYYIKLEELLHETMNEESNELKKQLEEKTDKIEQLNQKLHIKNSLKIITEEKFVIYLLVAYINDRTVYIIGKTADLTRRYRNYRLKGVLVQEKDVKLMYYKSCRSSSILKVVEKSVILNMSKYIMDDCSEVFQTDEYDEKEMIEKFKHVIDLYVSTFEHVSSNIIIKEQEDKEENRVRSELYLEENREEVNEKIRLDRLENPEKYRSIDKKRNPEKKKEKDKRYRAKNKEKRAIYDKEYSKEPEVIEKRKERKKEKFSEMTEEEKEYKMNKAKEYREQNKEKKDVLSKQKIICLVCQTKLSRSCWRRHTKSLIHLDAVKLNPDVIEKYEIEN